MPVSTSDGAPVPIVDAVALSPQQEEALARYVQQYRSYQAHSILAALAVRAVHEEKLYVKSGSFVAFAREEFGVGRSRAYQLRKAGAFYEVFRDAGVEPLPIHEGQLRPLVGLDLEDAKRAWEYALQRTGGEVNGVRQEDVEWAVAKVQGHLDDGAKPLPLDRSLVIVAHHLGDSSPPSESLAQSYASLLGRLHTEDQAGVWRRVAEEHRDTGDLHLDDDGFLIESSPGAVRDAVSEAVAALAHERRSPAAFPMDHPGVFTVSLEGGLLGDTAPNGDMFGRSVLVDYETAEPLIDPMLDALGAELDDLSGPEREAVAARRRMARCRLEPEIATWAWPILTPSHRRSARAWFAADDAPPPCFVPARLTQPENTKPGALDLRLPTAHTVLLAPGVDLTHPDLPSEVVARVLGKAAGSRGFFFLAAVTSASRVGALAWPSNVVPVLRAAGDPKDTDKRASDAGREFGDAAVVAATGAFERAGVRGVLVLDNHRVALSDDTVSEIAAHAAAVVMRGGETKQAVYNQMLQLRSPTLRFMSAPDVRCRPWDAMHDAPAANPQPERAAVPARLPVQA